MRILQVVQKPQRRGAEIFAFQLSKHLRLRGHEVRIAYLYPSEASKPLLVDKADIVLGKDESHPYEVVPGAHPLLLRRLLNVISDYKPEIVQVNGARTVKYGAFAHLLSRDKTWTLIYRNIGNPEDWVKGVLRQLLYRKVVIPQINGVVGVSQKTLDNLLAFYSISLPSIHIPRGVDIDELRTPLSCQAIRQDLGVPEQAPVLLYIGSLSPEKRLDRLFRIVKQVQRSLPTLKLWIVGDGPLRPKLEKDVVSLGIAENVQFWGLQEDVGRYITAANLLLLTSDTEGLPGVVLEAGILGLPALSTRVGGTEECIRHGETGMLFDPDCENEFAQAVTLLLQDSSQRREMGQRAQAFIESRFSMSRIADQYTKFYERILSTRRTV